jgi:hypothetical protein
VCVGIDTNRYPTAAAAVRRDPVGLKASLPKRLPLIAVILRGRGGRMIGSTDGWTPADVIGVITKPFSAITFAADLFGERA